jgi:hypothetical protein
MDYNNIDYSYIQKNIYALNIQQLHTVCSKLNIDYNIYIETNNDLKKINDKLHKEFIINKIFNVLIYKLKDKKIFYSNKIQNYSNTDNLKETDYIYYGQYSTINKNIKKLLMNLTNNTFKFGAISQKIIKKAWMQNKLLTYKSFAKEWLKEYNNGEINYNELAYNKFMKQYGDKNKWFAEKKIIIDTFKNMNLL